jgi:HEAT repeat protein
MTESPKVITEARLKTSLNDLAHSLVLELAMACKKLSIYSSGHPLGRGAVEKPYVILSRIFSFRKYVTFHTMRGQLYVCNICVKESVFTAQILQYMQILDVTVLRLESSLTLKEFVLFLERFVKRMRADDPDYSMNDYLTRNAVSAIEVNTEAAFKMFDAKRQYRGEIDDNFSVKRLVMDAVGSDPLTLARIHEADDLGLLALGIDFDSAIVRYLLPEKAASIPAAAIRSAAQELASAIHAGDTNRPGAKGDVNLYMALFKLIEWHPDREAIFADLAENHVDVNLNVASEEIDPRSRTGAIKTVTINRVEDVLDELFSPGNESYETTEFSDAFERLLKTGLHAKARETLARLLDLLSDANPAYRQKSLNLMACAVDLLKTVTDVPVFESVIETVVMHLRSKRETYEYSELIWKLAEKCLKDKRFDLLARITSAMAERRLFDQGVTIYDSMAVKKAFETMNRPEVIKSLVNELVTADFERCGCLKEILVAVGSEEVALELSQIIAHPVRSVRQQALKILAELGKASLKVFSRIIIDDSWFERDAERYELPDPKWYTIRNSIFVLGLLRDRDAISPLRLRISDHDIRVRREIISALEKIAGDDAIDVLIVMAEDPAREIRENAIGVIGIIGNPDVVPLLIDVARRNPTEAVRAVSVMGKLGGKDARNYLGVLLDDDTELQNLAAGKVSRDDLRLAVVRALGAIGDAEALGRIRQYQSGLSTAQKILFKNSPVNKAISEILARK